MTIYTAIFGSQYDDLKEPFVINTEWRHVCFTDQDLKSDVWEIVKVPQLAVGPQKSARYYKIMFHKHIDDQESIWIDATFIINCNLSDWWMRFKYPFTTIKHPFDDCIYREVKSCQRGMKGSFSQLQNQADCYRKLGVPKNNGLIASGILMRSRTDLVIEFCNLWWRQVEQWSARDQIAFGYVNHKFQNIHHSIEWDYTKEEEFIHIAHLSKPWRHVRFDKMKQKYGIKSLSK